MSTETTNRRHSRRKSALEQRTVYNEIFKKFDSTGTGVLGRADLRGSISEILGEEISTEHVDILLEEFDKDKNGVIDFSEFRIMLFYLQQHALGALAASEVSKPMRKMVTQLSARKLRQSLVYRSDEDMIGLTEEELMSEEGLYAPIEEEPIEEEGCRISASLRVAIGSSKQDSMSLLKSIAVKLQPYASTLCVQDHDALADIDDLVGEDRCKIEEEHAKLDPDFKAAFPPSDMRCLALVSHNGMKKTMREFVVANKNLLKKFRLTGTNSTMTMLKEVFKDEPAGSVVFGPSCASGPLGGDAELVALMVAGRIGGIMFFQDPMNAHPHRADIDCLVRQALVHNTMLAENPVTAYMLIKCLRTALQDGKAELIPSFFFSLQSPTVEDYKAEQKAVVDAQKALIK